MELVVQLLVGVAWPAAIIWVAMLFKGEIRSVLRRVSQLKYKDLEASFDEGLGKAEAKAAFVGPAAPALPHKPEILSRLEQLRRIAEVSPRAAILEAWVLVEEAAAKSGFIQGASIPRVNPYLFVEELIRLGKLPTGSSALIEQLRKLRNQAAHLPDFSITQDEADRYLELAAKASELILSVE
ncbi:DUF4145 domain-containing protein [Xanthomonas campestris]|uniref:DUF4145 domain-containing protein n=1 Tax=Xanthomonas campestris TaxID=339 RepID=UPI002358ECAB|nr:DUF4145 domain-containing protein [Xanthomonas campestris]MDC8748701.1 DUF4145 domain-containing protein [Xanthomonas campestris]